jgi:peptidoglycan/xylan/chitin deacetylase (PgdA/CDA1 family)
VSPKLRHFLHVALAEALHYSGALALRRWFRRKLFHKDEVCILGLHRVLTKAEQERSNSLDGMIIRDDTYLQLLEYVRRRFQVVSLDAFLAGAEKAAVSSKPLCLVTFDDGWADTYSRAFPGLRKFGLPAVVFLATGSIGSRAGFWVERVKKAWRNPAVSERIRATFRDLAPANAAPADLGPIVEWLKRMPTEKRNAILKKILPADGSANSQEEIDEMLTWDQAREMSDAGVEMGAHTVSHLLLSYEDAASVERELQLGKQALEEKLGTKVRAFAYPNGDWNESVRKQVADTGYRCAFTTRPAWYDRSENPYAVSRVLLHEGNITGQTGEFSPAMLDLTLAGWA